MDIATAAPVEIDTRIAEINRLIQDLEHNFKRLDYIIKNPLSEQALAKAEADAKELAERHFILDNELMMLHAEYNGRGGWNRFYLVTNSNGHVHTTMDCDTCFDTTDFGWLVQFSGTDREEMGKLAGMDACARCFPGLPAEIMKAKRDARVDTPERIAARQQREAEAVERDAKKAAKAAKAAAEAITNPDGTPVLDSIDYEITRESKVRSEYVTEAAQALFYDLPDEVLRMRGATDVEHAATCARYAEVARGHAARYLAALAHKVGITTEEMAAELDKKVQTKFRAIRREAVKEAKRFNF